MKKTWSAPEIQDLAISTTATNDILFHWWIPSQQPPKPDKHGKPGMGGTGGDGQSPAEFHLQDSLS
ncbi:MAG: hypothetical protein ACI4R6_09480 [Lachnospiraceae bacterium]